MKKNIMMTLICFIGFFLMLTGCGGGKYGDVLKLNQEYMDLMETYITDLEKADNTKEIAKAMNNFADGLEILMPKMKKLSEKYPELKDKDNPPEELKESQKEAEELGEKIVGSFMKIMPYMEDPEVQKAQQRLSMIMTK